VGAGISTSAGISDFRSPDTGIYAKLGHLDLSEPQDVFDIGFFRQNPKPFYTLARELAPGRYRPTIAHSFIRLLHDRSLLFKVFTQNIDGLERLAGVPGELIVEAHGSFANQHCIECDLEYPASRMKDAIEEENVPFCPWCRGFVKPDIVFFGEPLPDSFIDNCTLPKEADLCIIMGTSLSVQPFGELPSLCKAGTPRILINNERAGEIGSRPDDVLILGDCDDGVRQLAHALGWEKELEDLWERVCSGHKADGTDLMMSVPGERNMDREISQLTTQVDTKLGISNGSGRNPEGRGN
ncbi:DHS-like NAD/FAD-binding domain-containing protein, partial [Aspergillus keveii]